jgi:hypothetical protein
MPPSKYPDVAGATLRKVTAGATPLTNDLIGMSLTRALLFTILPEHVSHAVRRTAAASFPRWSGESLASGLGPRSDGSPYV